MKIFIVETNMIGTEGSRDVETRVRSIDTDKNKLLLEKMLPYVILGKRAEELAQLIKEEKPSQVIFKDVGVSFSFKNAFDEYLKNNRGLSFKLNSIGEVHYYGASESNDADVVQELVVNLTGLNKALDKFIVIGQPTTAKVSANLSDAWKAILGTTKSDETVKEIENLGISAKESIDKIKQWRKEQFILLDISQAAAKIAKHDTDKLAKSYADISEGVSQFAESYVPNIDDYEFLEASRDIESAKLKAVLGFIVEKESDYGLIDFLINNRISGLIDQESINEIVDEIKSQKLKNYIKNDLNLEFEEAISILKSSEVLEVD